MTFLWFGAGCPFVTAADLDAARDFDQDSFVSVQFGGDDCNDADPDVFPGAPDDWYDGVVLDCDRGSDFDQDGDSVPVDQDCDDLDAAQIEPPVWYLDGDGDGWGADTQSVVSCAPPGAAGFVDNALDCDDLDPAVGDVIVFFRDADGDGFGVSTDTTEGCEPPTGYVDNAIDCDDLDEIRFPGGVLFWDLDGDGFGSPASAFDACAPTISADPVALGGDCDDTSAAVFPGAAGELPFDGIDTNCDGETDLDGNGDGLPDIPSCLAVTEEIVTPADDLQQRVDLAADCTALVLEAGTYESVVVEGKSVAIRGRALAVVQIVDPGADVAFELAPDEPHALVLENLAISGFDAAVRLPVGNVFVGSALRVFEGVGVEVVAAPGLGGEVHLYGSSFAEGAEVVTDPPVALVELVEVTVDRALASRALIRGGDLRTELHGLVVRDTAVLGPAIWTLGGTLSATDVRFEDTFGGLLTAVLGAGTASTLERWVVLRGVANNARVIDVDAAIGVPPTLTVSDFEMSSFTWDERIDNLDLGSLVSITGVDTTLSGGWIRGVDTPRTGALIELLGAPATVSNLELSGAAVGLTIDGGTVENSTFVGFDKPLDPLDPLVPTTFRRVLVASCALPPTLSLSTWEECAFDDAPAPPWTEPVPGEPEFLRFHPNLDPVLWDLRLHATSALQDASDDATCSDPDGSPCAIGSTGGPGGSSETDLDLDGMYDAWELEWLGDADPANDDDGDGLDNRSEFDLGGIPVEPDTDDDGVDDGVDGALLDPDVH